MKTSTPYDLIKLSRLPLHKTTRVTINNRDVVLMTSLSNNGCDKCALHDLKGNRAIPECFNLCAANFRNDKQSVIFTKI